MYSEFYTPLETLIKEQLTAIKTVDWFNNQYNRNEQLKAIRFPAVFVEFENPTNWETASNGLQTADTSITFHLAYFDVADKPNNTLNLANQLHQLLHLFTLVAEDGAPISSNLVRRSSALLTDYNQLKVVKLTYNTTLFDCSTMQQLTEIHPTLDVKYSV